MIYRTKRRLGAVSRLIALPFLGMVLAISVSSTRAWAPVELVKSAAPVVVVLR